MLALKMRAERTWIDSRTPVCANFPLHFWHWGVLCTYMEHLDFPGSQLHEKYDV